MRIVNADGLESFAKQVSGSTSLEANFCILCGEFGANFNNCYRDLVPISTCHQKCTNDLGNSPNFFHYYLVNPDIGFHD